LSSSSERGKKRVAWHKGLTADPSKPNFDPRLRRTAETRRKISEGVKRAYKAHPEKWRKSEEVKKKISKVMRNLGMKISKTLRKRFAEGELRPWNKGLSADPNSSNYDPRLAERSKKASKTMKEKFARGELQPWNKGLRKEFSPKMREFAEKIKRKFATGELYAWNKGLTKETDPRVAKISEKLRLYHMLKAIEAVEKLYGDRLKGIKLTVRPASLRDHYFARKVLIEKVEFFPYIERTGLREHPYFPLRYKGDKVKIVDCPFPEIEE